MRSTTFSSIFLFALFIVVRDGAAPSASGTVVSRSFLRHTADDCAGEPIEQRVRKSDFVFTGTIKEIRRVDDKVEFASVEIKRVFKGENRLNLLFLSEVEDRIRSTRHKVCTVEGFEKDEICLQQIHEFDTWLFFTNARYGKLFLTSSLARLSLVAIAKADAAAKGRQYISPKITYFHRKDQDECPHKPCPFGGQCHKNLISGHYQCKCKFDCEAKADEKDMCGSDGETYKSECQLNETSCLMQKVISIDHEGACEARDPCLNVTCLFGSKCASNGASYTCACSDRESCDEDETNDLESDVSRGILCGSDGREYNSICELRYKACVDQRDVQVVRHGTCDPCQSLECHFGATCILYEEGTTASCACRHNCSQMVQKQCGSDGVTYNNICFMNKASCQKQEEILLLHNGPCVMSCNDEECRYGGTCTQGRCSCPTECQVEEEPVCGTDGVTYLNECALVMESCNRGVPVTVAHLGDCEEEMDMQDMCETRTCLFGGKCEISSVGDERVEDCICSFLCEDDGRMPICGSDKRIYFNDCYLLRAACRKQADIRPQPMQHCEGSEEEFCDGFPIMSNQSTGEELSCAGELDEDCPPEGYCHVVKDQGRCCEGYQVVSGCQMNQYGCCPDSVTAALGPNQFGCDIDDETSCKCNSVGSLESACDQGSRRCRCKPKVAGLRCDRCESNYWGFLRIADEDEGGCLACECNGFGSVREDCDQMTGQCMCLENVFGIKCDSCSDGTPVTKSGCPEGGNATSAMKNLKEFNKTKKPKISKPTKPQKIIKTKKTKQPSSKATKTTGMNLSNEAGVTKLFNENVTVDPTNASSSDRVASGHASATATTTTVEDISSTDYVTPYFVGDSYVELTPFDEGADDIGIEITFRTLSYNGLIFYAGRLDKKGDYISIAISNGSLEFRYDLGSGSTTLKIPSSVKLNYLHRATATRQGRDGLLKLDDDLRDAGVSLGKQKELDTGLPIYLGSVPDKSFVRQKNDHVNTGFHGCIDFLKIVSSAKSNQTNQSSHDYILSKSNGTNEKTDVVTDRKTYDCRESCTNFECINGTTCQTDKETVFVCKCEERYYGLNCEHEEELVEPATNRIDLGKRKIF